MAALQASVSAWIARVGAPAFRKVYRFDRAVRRKLTPAGWLLVAVLVMSAIFGLNTRDTFLYQLFGLSFGTLLVAVVASWRLRLTAGELSAATARSLAELAARHGS